jgi:hypothetical protein
MMLGLFQGDCLHDGFLQDGHGKRGFAPFFRGTYPRSSYLGVGMAGKNGGPGARPLGVDKTATHLRSLPPASVLSPMTASVKKC